jgi:hypothetical protein
MWHSSFLLLVIDGPLLAEETGWTDPAYKVLELAAVKGAL